MATEASEIRRLGYEMSVRQLAALEDRLVASRERALQILGVVTVTVSFLVGSVLRADPVRGSWFFPLALTGTVVFGVLVLTVALHLKPNTRWKTFLNPLGLDEESSLDETFDELIDAYSDFYEADVSLLRDSADRLLLILIFAGLDISIWVAFAWSSV